MTVTQELVRITKDTKNCFSTHCILIIVITGLYDGYTVVNKDYLSSQTIFCISASAWPKVILRNNMLKFLVAW